MYQSIIVIVILLTTQTNTLAQSHQQQTLIAQLTELTTATRIVTSLTQAAHQQLLSLLADYQVNTPEVAVFTQARLAALIDYWLIEQQGLIALSTPFFQQRFTAAELEQLRSFYQSIAGMKAVHYMPIDHRLLQRFIMLEASQKIVTIQQQVCQEMYQQKLMSEPVFNQVQQQLDNKMTH